MEDTYRSLEECVVQVLGEETQFDEDYEYSTEDECIQYMADLYDTDIEVHRTLIKNAIQRYNCIRVDDGDDDDETQEINKRIVRVFQSMDEENDEILYQIITGKNNEKKNTNSITAPRNNRMTFHVHAMQDIRILLRLQEGMDITKKVSNCVVAMKAVDMWEINFENLLSHFYEHNTRPVQKSKNDREKKLSAWFLNTTRNYDNIQYCMKDTKKRDQWSKMMEQYPHIFENNIDAWKRKLTKVIDHIKEHECRPSTSKNEDEKQLASWIQTQNMKYREKKDIMKNIEIYDIWTQTITTNYAEYFEDNIDIWKRKHTKVINHFKEHGCRPPYTSKNEDEKQSASWIQTQNTSYREKKGIMKNTEIYDIWTQTITTNYAEYFEDNIDAWKRKLTKLIDHIKEHGCRPSNTSKNKDERQLAVWIRHQNRNYKNKLEIMKNIEIYDIWTQTITTNYAECFEDNIDIWKRNHTKLIDHIKEHGCRPSTSKNKDERQLAEWINTQNKSYREKKGIMANTEIYDIWTQTITTNYAEYFEDNIDAWKRNHTKLIDHIKKHGCRPSSTSKDKDEKQLASWIQHQNTNYREKKHIMANTEIYDIWTQSILEYTKLPTRCALVKKDKKIKSVTYKQPRAKKSMSLSSQSNSVPDPSIVRENKRQRTEAAISGLHQKYKTLTSANLHAKFTETPELWYEYHRISEENELSFPTDSIPRNVIIAELAKIQTQRTAVVVDLGCGKAHAHHYFREKNDDRFRFINYDHVSENEAVTVQDISRTPLKDASAEIVILCLAMWGSNCRDNYIQEAYRILESRGVLYIIESTKRWSDKDDHGAILVGKEGIQLIELVERTGFTIMSRKIEKFCFLVCIK